MVKFKSKRQGREIFLMFFAIGTVIFMYHTRFYRPRAKELVETAAKIDARKQEVQQNHAIIGDLQIKVGDMDKKVEMAQNDKPTRFLSELINEINSKDSGVRVNSYTTKENQVENSIYAVNLDLDLESTFIDLATLIERLEEKYRFLEFKKVETSKVVDYVQKVTSKVSLSIYLDKEKI